MMIRDMIYKKHLSAWLWYLKVLNRVVILIIAIVIIKNNVY